VCSIAIDSAIAGKATLEDAFAKAAQDYDKRVFGGKLPARGAGSGLLLPARLSLAPRSLRV
jgi:hypothetical protein